MSPSTSVRGGIFWYSNATEIPSSELGWRATAAHSAVANTNEINLRCQL
jgi:hypothetical protein